MSHRKNILDPESKNVNKGNDKRIPSQVVQLHVLLREPNKPEEPESPCLTDWYEFISRRFQLHIAVRHVIPMTSRSSMLHKTRHITLAEHSGERCMYDTLQQVYNGSHRDHDIYICNGNRFICRCSQQYTTQKRLLQRVLPYGVLELVLETFWVRDRIRNTKTAAFSQ